jgi:hypothetical protein
MRILILLAYILVGSVPALASDDYKAYAVASVTAIVAGDKCPGLVANKTELRLLQRLTVRDEDAKPLKMEMLRLIEVEIIALGKEGTQTWCSNAADMFGPDGTIMPRLIEAR